MYFRKRRRKQRRLSSNKFDLETSFINSIQNTNSFLNGVKNNIQRFSSNKFDLETPFMNSIQNTNSFLSGVKNNIQRFSSNKFDLETPFMNSIQNTNSFLNGVKNNIPFINSVNNKNKMGKVLSPGLVLLMLVFSYSVKSQISANLNTKTMNIMKLRLDEALSSMKVKGAAYKEKLPSPEKLVNGLKGWQDAFDMNVHYQLQKIGVPSQLEKMGFEAQLGKNF